MIEASYPIDIVVTWVDGNDPAWRAQKAAYTPGGGADSSSVRYRDWDLMRYWFRGVEKFCPWVRTIHFVTWGHLPEWLDTANPKLHIVNHTDYIPEEYLPTFSSHPLEMNLHRIKGLAEHFVYFNDDVFCIRPIQKKCFFKNGLPCDFLAFEPITVFASSPMWAYLRLNNITLLARHFDKKEIIKKHFSKCFSPSYPLKMLAYNAIESQLADFTGLRASHGPAAFCKETFEEVWTLEHDMLHETSKHRFRSKEDVSPYVFRHWQTLSGKFYPMNIDKLCQYYQLSSNNLKLCSHIEKQKTNFICINDSDVEETVAFEKVKAELQRSFSAILPEKCSFEK